MAQNKPKQFFACEHCNKAYTSKYGMHRHMNCAHLDKATKFSCSIEACHYSCYRPEDLLMHEKRHSDPNFKTKQKNTNNNTIIAQSMQSTEASSSETGYTHQEFVQALQQQLFQEPNQDAISTVDFSYFQDNPQVITPLEPTKNKNEDLNTPPLIDQNIYQPAVSDISSESTVENPQYQAGLLIYADASGLLKTDPKTLIPGMHYICNENYELVPSTDERFKELNKDTEKDDQAQTSFTVTVKKNPGKNYVVNNCATQ